MKKKLLALVMLFVTSAKLAGFVLLIVPAVVIPIIVLGRRLRALSRESQDWIAASSGKASEALLSAQPDDPAGDDGVVSAGQIQVVHGLGVEPGGKPFPVRPLLAYRKHVLGWIAAIYVQT